MSNPTVTVFTTTYNRENCLRNLYDSLCKQTCNDFEWLVVDDGSSDNTEKLINSFKNENKCIIHFERVPQNRGIANAMNIGIEKANGVLFFKIDSDETVKSDAIYNVIYWQSTIANLSGYAGVAGQIAYHDGSTIGGEWGHDARYVDITNFQRKKYGLSADQREAYYTSLLREFGPFPRIDGENYAFEGLLWNRIAHAGYQLRFFDSVVSSMEYSEDGFTRNVYSNCVKCFRAYSLFVSELCSYHEVDLSTRIMAILSYNALG